MDTSAIILVFLGLAVLVGGTLIAMVATHGAPDGFEDQEGFHLSDEPPVAGSK